MKNIFAIIAFQIGVNVIGLPEFAYLETDEIIGRTHINKNKFTK